MKNRKGVALIWTLILSTILIITSTTMVSYIIKDSQFSVRIEESTQVYAAAKSGAEWGRWYLSQNGNNAVDEYNFNLLTDNEDNETQVVIAPLDSGGYSISSESTANGVTRKLKYSILNNAFTPVVLKTPIANINTTPLGASNRESFTMQFDLWFADTTPANFELGAYDKNNNKLYFSLVGNTFNLTAVSNGSSLPIGTLVAQASTTKNNPLNSYRVQIIYLKNTAARLKVISNSDMQCIGSVNLDLSGIEFGDLSNLYFYTTSPADIKTDKAYGPNYYIVVQNTTKTKVKDYINNIYIRK